jgi:hypothetical protein
MAEWPVRALRSWGRQRPRQRSLADPTCLALVRAGTPASLIADDAFRSGRRPELLIVDDAGTSTDSSSLGHVVQDRIYTAGPTELLRIASELDGRTGTLDSPICASTTRYNI